MEPWGADHPTYSVISTPTMSFITPFGMVCTLHFLLVMHRLSVNYRISALSAQKSDYRYRLKFSRYFRCIHNSIRREYIQLHCHFGGKIFVFSLNFY